jgi:hypothetical protein
MEAELAKLPHGNSPADFARASLRAIGTAYLRFAQEETGLFWTAFAIPDETRCAPVPAKAGNSGLNPFQLLGAAPDRLVEAGVLPPERRPGVNAGEGSFCTPIDRPRRRNGLKWKKTSCHLRCD